MKKYNARLKASFHKGELLPYNLKNNNLSGFSKRSTGREGFGPQELKFSVLWLQSEDEKILLITIDVLYISDYIFEVIYEYVKSKFNFKKSSLFISATHTHSAPNVSWGLQGSIDNDYLAYLVCVVKTAILKTSKNLSVVKLTYNKRRVEGNSIVFRRRYGLDIKKLFFLKKMLMLPNESKVIDNYCRSINVNFNEKKVVLFNVSCHPVFSNSIFSSSDFPGEVCELIEKGKNVEACFFQGWCGDIRPNITSKNKKKNLLNYMKSFFNGDVFVSPSIIDFNVFCERVLSSVFGLKCLDLNGEIIRSQNHEFNVKSVCGGTEKKIILNLAKIDKVIMISINAEISNEYIVELSCLFSDYDIIPIGCANGMIGYLPYPEHFNEGGYEVDSFKNYGWQSKISMESLIYSKEMMQESIKSIIHNG